MFKAPTLKPFSELTQLRHHSEQIKPSNQKPENTNNSDISVLLTHFTAQQKDIKKGNV